MPILQQYESNVHTHKKQRKPFIKQYTYWTFPKKKQKGYGAKFTKKNEKMPKNIVPNSLMSYIFIFKKWQEFFSILKLQIWYCYFVNVQQKPSLGKQNKNT